MENVPNFRKKDNLCSIRYGTGFSSRMERTLRFINYVITESEVVTEKSQTEASPVGRGLRFSRNDLTVEVIKLFIIWHTKIKQKSQS